MLEHWLALGLAGRSFVLLHLGLLVAIAVYGVHRLASAVGAHRTRPAPLPPPLEEAELPVVTVQLPIFNELHVVDRLLAAVAALDWPRARLEVQVLDDSSDATSRLAARGVARLRALGIDARHLRRRERTGFKAGALAAGLRLARGELVAVFDADFVPPPRFLRDLAGHFRDPAVGLVQARWGHLNRRQSLWTEVQAVLLDGHFLVEQRVRAGRGHFFNFNGTAGIWRRTAIEDAGGWQADTLTEDLDLSYRAQLRGWRFVFRPDVVVPAELPGEVDAFKSQQHRWAKGSAQAVVKLLPSVLRARIPLATKVEAVFHLTGNFGYVLLLALALCSFPAIALRYRDGWTQALAIELPFLVFATLSVAAFYAVPLRQAREGRTRWLLLPALMALGIGMSLNNARAVLGGLLSRAGEFRRTPKRGRSVDAATDYRVATEPWVALELVLALHFALLLGHAVTVGLVLSVPFLLLFAAGFLMTGIGSLAGRAPRRTARPATG